MISKYTKELDSLVGRTIFEMEIFSTDKDRLMILFEDGAEVTILDIERFCCERRYLTTDSDLTDARGAKILKWDWREYDDENLGSCEEYFLFELQTTKGNFEFHYHNEHNGHYCGWDICVELNEYKPPERAEP